MPRALTVLHPGAAADARRWPAERFAAVAERLVRQGHRVVLTGSPAERQLVERIGRASGGRPMSGLSLRQLFGLVARARLVISGDTGIAHVASLYRTPSVLLFGPVAPSRWGPPASGPHRVLWHGDGSGNPHGDEPDPALLRITVPEVLAAIEQLEATAQPGHSAAGRQPAQPEATAQPEAAQPDAEQLDQPDTGLTDSTWEDSR